MAHLPSKGISRTHKNEVHQALATIGLDPSNFTWLLASSGAHRVDGNAFTVPRLSCLSDQQCFFTFDRQGGDYLLVFAPGVNKEESREVIKQGWPSVLTHVQAWASRVKAEVEAPDLWAESAKERQIVVAAACTAPGFLDSGLTVFASTLPRPARGGRVAPGRGFDSRISPASTVRCMSA